MGGIKSHATDKNCEPGVHHLMNNGTYSMSSLDRGIKSHATDKDCEPGEHLMNNGTHSMPILDRVTKADIAS